MYLADGTTAVTAQQTLSLEELRGLTFLPAENAAGQTTFSFSVTTPVMATTPSPKSSTSTSSALTTLPSFPPQLSPSAMHRKMSLTPSLPADLLAGVTDPDVVYDAEGNITSRDVDNLNVINLSVTNGELTYDAASDEYTFSPDDNFNGVARFNYLITDGNGGSVSNTVSLNVVAINDTPEATFSTNQFTAEGNSAISGQLTSTDIDKKAADGSLDAEWPSQSSHHYLLDGVTVGDPIDGLTINPDGSWSLIQPTTLTTASLLVKPRSSTSTIRWLTPGNSLDTNSFQITVTGTNDDPKLTELLQH